MLTIAPLRASQASHYFTKDNYSPTTQASQNSRWLGKGAAALGLTGEVDAAVFKALLEGKMPNGKPLTGKNVTNLERHRAGFDQCFEAPKSVSIVALWKGDDRIVEAHQHAVQEAIALTEEWCAQARVWDGKEQIFQITDNLIVGSFTHTTSRLKDPHLHDHNVTINATQLGNCKWRALAAHNFYRTCKLRDAFYQASLAHQVQQIGYETEFRPDGLWEIKGYTQEQLDWYSKRHHQIIEAAGENATVYQKNQAWEQTRSRKGKAQPLAELREQWDYENAVYQLGVIHPEPRSQPAESDGYEITRETLIAAIAQRLSISKPIATPNHNPQTAIAQQLQRKELSPIASFYTRYYAIDDWVIPLRDYPKQQLKRGQHYQVIELDRHHLTLKAPDGNVHLADPLKFRKTVYQAQSIEVAVGDRCFWTSSHDQHRTGQKFQIIHLDSTQATIQYSGKKTAQIDLTQPHHFAPIPQPLITYDIPYSHPPLPAATTAPAIAPPHSPEPQPHRRSPHRDAAKHPRIRADHAQLRRDIAALTAGFNDRVESIYGAIANHADRRAFLRVASILTAAVGETTHHLEQLESAYRSQHHLATAIDHLDRKLRNAVHSDFQPPVNFTLQPPGINHEDLQTLDFNHLRERLAERLRTIARRDATNAPGEPKPEPGTSKQPERDRSSYQHPRRREQPTRPILPRTTQRHRSDRAIEDNAKPSHHQPIHPPHSVHPGTDSPPSTPSPTHPVDRTIHPHPPEPTSPGRRLRSEDERSPRRANPEPQTTATGDSQPRFIPTEVLRQGRNRELLEHRELDLHHGDLGRNADLGAAVAGATRHSAENLPTQPERREAPGTTGAEPAPPPPESGDSAATPTAATPAALTQGKAHYERLWSQYSQRVIGDCAIDRDLFVARQALKSGESRNDVALMLIAASPYVQGMAATQEVKQGNQERMYVVMNYVEQTVRAAAQEKQVQVAKQKQQSKGLEL